MNYPTAITAVSMLVPTVPHISNLTWAYAIPVDAYLVEVGYKTIVESETGDEVEITRAHTFDMVQGQFPGAQDWVTNATFEDYLQTLEQQGRDL